MTDETIDTLAQDMGAPEAEPIEQAEAPEQDEIAEGQELDAESEASTDEEKESRKPSKGVQKRFSEMTRKQRELQGQLSQAMDVIHRLSNGQQQPTQQQRAPQPVAEPVPKDFVGANGEVDPLAYLQALSDYRAEQKVKPVMDTVRQLLEAQQAMERQAVMASVQQRENQYAQQHPGYHDALAVAQSHPLFETPLAAEIVADPDGPAIAHYLGDNPEEMDRLVRLPPARQLRELGRIAAIATQSAPKPAATRVSNAPPPIKPVRSAGRTDSGYLGRSDLNTRDWLARREADLKRSG